jgi:hypothetical protein
MKGKRRKLTLKHKQASALAQAAAFGKSRPVTRVKLAFLEDRPAEYGHDDYAAAYRRRSNPDERDQ